nr:UDP-N-acetylmuramoyl-L-alanyl-D-glutamate--2,6-diaminopimelate ligase [Candidatus Levybacteria bacterium]
MWQKIKNKYHLLIAIVANIIFLFPSRGMRVIAVTGTDGKTTTVNLIYHILKTAGYRVSMISSVGATIDDKNYDTGFHVTTPSSFLLQKFLKKAKDAKTQFFVLEVTSHAIDQNRIFGIKFDIAVLTNVTKEHLDYHKDFKNYLNTKAKLLKLAKFCVINRDDKSYDYLSGIKNYGNNLKTFGLSKNSDVNPLNFNLDNFDFIGDFNKYNIWAATSVARVLGLRDENIKKALKNFKMPVGRANYVYKKDFSVMIDFAHTSNAFEKILSSVRPIVKAKIIHVFGSAGERDKEKRPFLGKISSKYSDIIILTAEDPRSENVKTIVSEIDAGIQKNKSKVIKILDRKEAINKAIQMARKGDLVLITGKAQEASMNLGNGEVPWDEFEVVKDVLNNIKIN